MRADESTGKVWDTRYSFDAYLRTGRLILKEGSQRPVEVKFNPWHDPDDGRFTFAGTGVYYGRGGTAYKPGEGYGGAGASGSWESSAPRSKPQSPKPGASREAASRLGTTPSRGPAQAQPKPWKQVTRNGYVYSIDQAGRTRLVSGSITLAPAPARSRTAQARAGGMDRRPTDDGGHYIAHRFNGPAEAFNHFAQNANFNRGGYRVLEDKWAAAKREGKSVQVTIMPSYDNSRSQPQARLMSGSTLMERETIRLSRMKPKECIMESDKTERLLNEIGRAILASTEYPQHPMLLYAELDFNMIGQSIFIDLGNHIVYHWGGQRLSYMLLDLWESSDPKKRWAEIEYVIRDGRFEVSFIYPEDIDASIDSFDRRDRIVEKYFGEKPIHYPPLPTIDNYSFDL